MFEWCFLVDRKVGEGHLIPELLADSANLGSEQPTTALPV